MYLFRSEYSKIDPRIRYMLLVKEMTLNTDDLHPGDLPRNRVVALQGVAFQFCEDPLTDFLATWLVLLEKPAQLGEYGF